jgi:hypothetical protein
MGQSKVLSECDVDPMAYLGKVKGSQMKPRVLWVYCKSDVHDYACKRLGVLAKSPITYINIDIEDLF